MFVAIRDRVQRAIEVEYERVYRIVYRGVAGDGRPRVGVRHRVMPRAPPREPSRGIFPILCEQMRYVLRIYPYPQ